MFSLTSLARSRRASWSSLTGSVASSASYPVRIALSATSRDRAVTKSICRGGIWASRFSICGIGVRLELRLILASSSDSLRLVDSIWAISVSIWGWSGP